MATKRHLAICIDCPQCKEKYKNGKVYKLTNSVDDATYIGSTYCSLTWRMAMHKKDCKKNSDQRVYKHYTDIGFENVSIELIEDFPCEMRQQLLSREYKWMKELKPSLNKNIPTRTHKQWQNDNRDKKNETNRKFKAKNREKYSKEQNEYYHKNKEVINEKRKQKVDCIQCGKLISKSNFGRHMKTMHE